jgi:hypothetical protein
MTYPARNQDSMPTKISPRRPRGSVLVESAVGISLFPLLLLLIVAAAEASSAYIIKDHITQSAYLAARAISSAYQSNPNLQSDKAAQQAIFAEIRVPHFVADNAQFTFPANAWQTGANLKTVTVTCSYASGRYGLAPFPTVSPLSVDVSFEIKSSATCRLN